MFSTLRFGMSLALLTLVSLQPIYGAGMDTVEHQKHTQDQKHAQDHQKHPQEEMHSFSFKDSTGHTHEGLYYLKEVPCPVGFKPQGGSPGHSEHKGEKPVVHHATGHVIPEQKAQHAVTVKPQQATVEDLPKPQSAKISPALPPMPEQVRIEAEASSKPLLPPAKIAEIPLKTGTQNVLEAAKLQAEATDQMLKSTPPTP